MLITASLLVSCLLLYLGGDWLLRGAKAIGYSLGWSPAFIGLVLVSFGTSSPELFLVVSAAFAQEGDIAVGNVIGSNIVNITVVLGVAIIIGSFSVYAESRLQLLGLMGLTTLVALLLRDGVVSRIDGMVLLSLTFVGFAVAYLRMQRMPVIKNADLDIDTSSEVSLDHTVNLSRMLLLSVGGITFLVIGSNLLVWGGVQLASWLSVPKVVVGLTVLAIGTSLPEITATTLAVVRGDTRLAFGNILGSNLLNIGLVLGMGGAISPLNSDGLDSLSIAYFVLTVLVVMSVGLTKRSLNRGFGALLLSSYVLYVAVITSNNYVNAL